MVTVLMVSLCGLALVCWIGSAVVYSWGAEDLSKGLALAALLAVLAAFVAIATGCGDVAGPELGRYCGPGADACEAGTECVLLADRKHCVDPGSPDVISYQPCEAYTCVRRGCAPSPAMAVGQACADDWGGQGLCTHVMTATGEPEALCMPSCAEQGCPDGLYPHDRHGTCACLPWYGMRSE